MIRFLLPIFVVVLATLTSPISQSAESYIVLERHSKRVLLADGSEYRRPVGSIAHLVTAKVTLDWMAAAGVPKTTMIVVPNHTYFNGIQNPLGLQAGDRLSIRDALYASVLGEDCVSATALAHHVGQSLLQRRGLAGDPQSAFVREMNNLAQSYGMSRTQFKLPSGADNLRRNSHSTASDVARLVVKLSTDSALGFYTKQKQRSLSVTKQDGKVARISVLNTNKLLSSKFRVAGLKAANGVASGKCVAITADKNSYSVKLPNGGERITPVQLVVVVLGSADSERFAELLIPQGWAQYEKWRNNGYTASSNRREFLVVPQ